MIMRRKEVKEHGTKKMIEGVFEKGHTCLIFEDLITSGASIFETITPIEEVGMHVKDIVVFLDREHGGKKRLEEKGYNMHAVLTLSKMVDILHENRRISSETKNEICKFVGAKEIK